MEEITFGELLEKLLYLANQKKSSLAKVLGYDISYISKWINSKNLPSTKNISNICTTIADYIVNSLTTSTFEDVVNYFEIDVDGDDKDAILSKYIEKALKESYLSTTGSTSTNIIKSKYSQETYNSICHVKPRLRKQYLLRELNSYVDKLEANDKLEILIYANLFNFSLDEKMSLAITKEVLSSFEKKDRLSIKLVTGFKYNNNKDELLNYIIMFNLIASHPTLDFKMYNCDISPSTGIFAIKNKILYVGIYRNDGISLLTSMSKEKKVVDEFYDSLDDMLNSQGYVMYEEKTRKELITENIYMEYIMGHDIRLFMGSMNEFFMPTDLFEEVAEQVFGYDQEIINKLKKINIFLQNVTYKSEFKVLMYENEFRKYLSSGEMQFFNNPVKLTFKQREKHIKHMEKIIAESSEMEIKFIEKDLVEELPQAEKPTLFLSKDLKIIKFNSHEECKQYGVLYDTDCRKMCNEFFEFIWNRKENMNSDRNEVLEKVSKSISYMKIINENIEKK